MEQLRWRAEGAARSLVLAAGRAASRRLASPATRGPAAWVRRGIAAWLGDPPARAPVEVGGIRVGHPVGVAAGVDKSGEMLALLAALGAGSVEVGTVTARPWPGNAGRVLARLPGEGALWNRLGLPGPGAAAVAARLATRPPGLAVGVNLAPTPGLAPAARAGDLADAIARLAPRADWVTGNLSCPNLGYDPRGELEGALATWAEAWGAAAPDPAPPLLFKLSPGLPEPVFGDVVAAARAAGARGLVLVNTRPHRLGALAGGLSGDPLRDDAVAAIRRARRAWPEAVLVGVGGVRRAGDARRLLAAGADWVQVYSTLVLDGPRRLAEIARGSAAR